MRIIRKEACNTKVWSGGTTTEIAIYPEGADYAERDFIWRISSAAVEDEESTFTSLPDYMRYLTLRQGSMGLSHDGGEWHILRPGEVEYFDGASETKSRGRVTDFNLMLRKGKAEGGMEIFSLKKGERLSFGAMGAEESDEAELAFFVSSGEAEIAANGESEVLKTGDAALLSGKEDLSLCALEDSSIFAALIKLCEG